MILIYCDGGFGNRVNSLISGMALADILGYDYLVLWPRNNRCGAAFDQLFIPHCTFIEARLQDFRSCQSTVRLWLHENDFGFDSVESGLRTVSDISAFKQNYSGDDRKILFSENTILPWIPEHLVYSCLQRLAFQRDIVSRAQAVMDGRVPGSFFGIHLRGTDFPASPPVEKMKAVVLANPGHTFFVCSDDAEIEHQFDAIPNVFIHQKNSHVEKLAPGAWRCNVLDSDGLPYTSNIDRTSESVVEAVIDILLLGASVPLPTSASSFLALSERLRSSGVIASVFE